MTYSLCHYHSKQFYTSRRLLSTFALHRNVDERRLPHFIRILLRETRGERVKYFQWNNYSLFIIHFPPPKSEPSTDNATSNILVKNPPSCFRICFLFLNEHLLFVRSLRCLFIFFNFPILEGEILTRPFTMFFRSTLI